MSQSIQRRLAAEGSNQVNVENGFVEIILRSRVIAGRKERTQSKGDERRAEPVIHGCPPGLPD